MPTQPTFANVTCSSTGHPGVGRFRTDERRDLWLVAVSRQRPGSSGNGVDSGAGLHGSVNIDDEYPGCPSCRADNVVHCAMCNHLSCYDNTWSEFHCPSCGNSGEVGYGTGTLSLSGLGQY